MSRNIFVSKKNVHVQIITQSGRAELGMYAEDERGRVPTRCTAFIHNLRGQGGWWVGEGQQHRLSGVPDVEGWQQVGAAQCEFWKEPRQPLPLASRRTLKALHEHETCAQTQRWDTLSFPRRQTWATFFRDSQQPTDAAPQNLLTFPKSLTLKKK